MGAEFFAKTCSKRRRTIHDLVGEVGRDVQCWLDFTGSLVIHPIQQMRHRNGTPEQWNI